MNPLHPFKNTRRTCPRALRVGFFLAVRQLKRTSKWTTGLIVFIMMLTFLNLVFVSGILSGLVEGSSIAYRKQYSGDILISNYESKEYINDTTKVMGILESFDEVIAFSPRLLVGGMVEANYRELTRLSDNPDRVSVQIGGIDPEAEDNVTGLRKLLVAGEYLEEDDQDYVLVGSNLLETYSRDVPGDETIGGVDVGSRIRITINDVQQEVVVKGVVKSKIGEVGRRIYITDTYLRKLIARPNLNVNEIAVLLKSNEDPYYIKEALQRAGVCDCALIETWQESQGQFFKDISTTFEGLGLMIGSIGIVVASITVFIVIFINAVTRRKYIGILKGIGIGSGAIEFSYVLQSIFYAAVGSLTGFAILFGLIKPYIDENPIDFPFSDGILVAPLDTTLIRIGVLLFVTIVAGFIPAKLIVRKNTLDSILGR